MAFRIFLVHLYALAQLYVVSFRSTVKLRALWHLFLVGALSCVPAAIALVAVGRHYFGNFSHIVALTAGVEEVVKAFPVFYLLFRTRVGISSSPLDGLLYGAASGAGFGFGEDAIHMIENASITYSPYTSVTGVLLAWLPGGWANGNVWFPGHMALAALVGAGAGLGRRLFSPTILRVAVSLAALSWAIAIHSNFNSPDDPGVSSISNFFFYQLNGGGAYVALWLLVVVVALTMLDELVIRKQIALSTGGASRPILADLAALVEGLGRGWRPLVKLRTAQKLEGEIIQLRWEIQRLQPPNSEVASAQIAALQEAQSVETGGALQPAVSSGFWSFRGLSPSGLIYRIAALPVLAYGFWLVFLSPSFEHQSAVAFSATTLVTVVSGIGQVLMFWRVAHFVRNGRKGEDPPGGSALAVARCQTILIWSGCLTCLVALKDLYDVGALPYPLQADVYDKYAQLRLCYSPQVVPKTVPGLESPAITTGSARGSKYDTP